jgi:hypothetical protein
VMLPDAPALAGERGGYAGQREKIFPLRLGGLGGPGTHGARTALHRDREFALCRLRPFNPMPSVTAASVLPLTRLSPWMLGTMPREGCRIK